MPDRGNHRFPRSSIEKEISKNKTFLRKYFDINRFTVTCKLCSFSGLRKNMHRHLRLLHPVAYKEFTGRNEKIIKERVSIIRDKVGGKRRSWTRKYYCRVNEDFVKCKICDRLLKISHGSYTGNINRHIRLKHPYVFFDEIKSNNSTQDDSSDEHTVKGMEHVLINESHESAERDSHSEDQDDHAVDSNIEKSVDNKSDVDQTGQALSEDELLIINKCRNRVIGKQHTASASRYYSWTHKYYRKINDKYNKCKICKITLKRNSLNNGNIHRHIRNKHPYIYFNETTKRRRDDCNLEYNKDAVKDDMLETGQPFIEDELKIKSDDDVVDKQLDTSRKLRYQSWSRKYYHKIDDKSINCIICKRVFNVEHIGNMYRHIKNIHPDIYFNETNSKTTKNETQRTEIRQEIETAVKQIFYIKEVDKIIKKDDNTEVQDEKALDSHINQSQDDMPDIDEAEKPLITTEELITKRIIERKNWSWTRKYYHKINDEGLIKCRVCDKILHFNIHRHIKNKHPDIYLKENPTASSSGPSVEEELRIKNLCGNTGKRAPKSCFWNFFEMIEQDRVYKCSFCQKSIVIFPKSVANLKRHIANVHQRQYEIILKYEESETKNLIALAASKAEVPGVSSVEITFLSLDDGDTGKYKCSRCDEVFDCKEEEDAVLIEHVQVCKLKPKLSTAESDEKVVKGIEEQNDWMIR